ATFEMRSDARLRPALHFIDSSPPERLDRVAFLRPTHLVDSVRQPTRQKPEIARSYPPNRRRVGPQDPRSIGVYRYEKWLERDRFPSPSPRRIQAPRRP